jgi:hypothetical protein
MGQPESLSRRPRIRRACPERCRRDGWTAERQLAFLDALTRARSVSRAAASVGMSRESAYRLRARREGALFGIARDRAMQGPALSASKGHKFAAVERSVPPISRANVPKACLEHGRKVTKWRKWKNPRFQSLLDQLREL